MSDDPADRVLFDAVLSHLSTHLGPPIGAARVDTEDGDVELLRFEPMPGALVLSSRGCGLRSPDERRLEGIMTLPADPSEAVLGAACAILGAFAERLARPDPIRPGFAAAGEVFDPLDFDRVLVLPPVTFAPTLHRVEIPGQAPVGFAWLVPGYEEELEYARQHGPRALLDLFEAQRLSPQDFRRGPASTLVTPEDAARLAGRGGGDGASGEDRGYRVEQVRGGVRIERRRRRIGKAPMPPRVALGTEPAVAPPRRPSSDPSQDLRSPAARVGPPPRARIGPPPRGGGARSERARFDLAGPESPEVRPEIHPEAPPEPEASPVAPLDPAEAKRRRVEALKAKAVEARARAEARQRGEGPATPASRARASLPEKDRAVLAAERRRGRLARSGRPPDPASD